MQNMSLIMSHNLTGMSCMQNPSKGLGEVITGVNNPRNEGQSYVTSFFPVLCGEVLNIDMADRSVGTRAFTILIAD